MSQTLERLIALVSEMSGIEKSQLSAGLAVDQDIEFHGDDVI